MEERFLFRAKRMDNREWIEGGYAKVEVCDFIILPNVEYDDDAHMEIPQLILVDPSTVCQCTGDTDKNGNTAYENDILKTPVGLAKIVWRSCHTPQLRKIEIGFCVVFFEQTANDYYRHDLGYWLKEGTVIGNIFDNPELFSES